MIVVIDTNVWISALQFPKRRGTPALALERAMSEDVIATCDEIDAEIVLTEKFSWEQYRVASALQAILARGVRVTIRGTVKVLPGRSEIAADFGAGAFFERVRRAFLESEASGSLHLPAPGAPDRVGCSASIAG